MADGAVKPGGIWSEGLFAYLIFEIKDEQGLEGILSFGAWLYTARSSIKNRYHPSTSPSRGPPTHLPQTVHQIHSLAKPTNRSVNLSGESSRGINLIFTYAVYADKLLSIDLVLEPHA
jgi:hypothetical protein